MSFFSLSLIPALPVIACALALHLVFTRFVGRRATTTLAPLPPGPFPWPVVGNLFVIPRALEWITFCEWGKTYGDVIHLSTFGRSIVVLNSAKAAADLLDKRSSIYSDRPHMVMAGDLMGWDRAMGLTPYNARFRETRRLAKGVLGPGAVNVFEALEERVCTRFVERVMETPEAFLKHIRHAAGAIVLSISYGYDVSESGTDPLVQLAESCMDTFSLAVTPGVFLVDFIPWLRYIPAFLPGMSFRRKAVTWRKQLNHMADMPHQFTKSQMELGKARTSFVSKLLEDVSSPETEEVVKWAALSLYGGGTDTTVAALTTFILAILTHPHAQHAAQAELDSVIGSDRLPTISDRARLPYVDALVKEVVRWSPSGPLGIPHRLMEEDTYNGYRIPAGAMVIANIWAMLRDPSTYSNPDTFNPERFLGPKAEPNPCPLAFGFGRRSCPGQHLAEPFLFICIATTLATLSISKATDTSGRVIEPEVEWMSGTISHPKPFKCHIEPRSVQAANLIKRMGTEHKCE